jgi:DNA-binding LacI/PurR family transcriptional regulator
MRDVARLAGVSAAAVSRALNPDASASPAMREKVSRAATRLGYRPNIIARSLSQGRSGIIALVLSEPSRPFYAEAVAAAARTLQGAGKRLMVVQAPADGPDAAIADVLAYAVDGLIIASATPSPRMVELCRREARPLVLFNRAARLPGLSSMACDDRGAGRLAARVLAESGARRPGFLGGAAESSTSRDRLAGFRDGLTASGLPLPILGHGAWRYEVAFAEAERLLRLRAAPDALFCANDVMACASLDAARRLGVALSVIGFDDNLEAAWEGYQLTTFRVPFDTMLADALSALDLPAGAPPIRRRFAPRLIERASVLRRTPRD